MISESRAFFPIGSFSPIASIAASLKMILVLSVEKSLEKKRPFFISIPNVSKKSAFTAMI